MNKNIVKLSYNVRTNFWKPKNPVYYDKDTKRVFAEVEVFVERYRYGRYPEDYYTGSCLIRNPDASWRRVRLEVTRVCKMCGAYKKARPSDAADCKICGAKLSTMVSVPSIFGVILEDIGDTATWNHTIPE